MRRWFLLAAIVAAIALGWPARALAHAVLLRSTPAQNARLTAAPASVDLFFSEPLEKKLSTVEVRNTAGARVDKNDVSFTNDPTEMRVDLQPLKPGFYTVLWTTVSSIDGHKLTGSYPFTVLNPDGSMPAGAPPPAATTTSGGNASFSAIDSAVRWLLLLGLIGMAGGFAFSLFVLYPVAATLPWPESREGRRFALWLADGAVAASALLALIMDVAALIRLVEAAGGAGSLATTLSGTAGRDAVIRGVLIALTLLLSWALSRREKAPDGVLPIASLGTGLLLSLGALLTMSLTSHAAAGAGSAWAVPSDFLHLAAVALWLGGVALLPALLIAPRDLPQAARLRFQGGALRRFSTMALLCVGVVLLSGTFNALVQMPDWRAFLDTAYGRTLLIKLILIVPLLAIALLNAAGIARRFERAALDGSADAPARATRLVRSAIAETVAGAVVIAATAILVFFVPAKDAVAQARASKLASAAPTVSSVYRNTAPANDLQVGLTVTPNRVGQNDFKVVLTGPDIDKVTRVQLRFQLTNGAAGLSTLDLQPAGGTPGLYEAQAANLSFVGFWRVTVNIRRTGHDDANAGFTVEVPDTTGATTANPLTAQRGATAFPAHGITEEQVWGALLVAGGLALLVFRGRLWSLDQRLGQASLFCMVVAVAAGLVVLVAGRGRATTSYAALIDPVPADQRSIADGRQLYLQNCAQCHGETGHGDGPAAAALNPRPLDLTVHVGLHPDGQLFDWITNGIPRTSMPAWKQKLTDQQRWDIINYLRTLSVTGERLPGATAETAAWQP